MPAKTGHFPEFKTMRHILRSPLAAVLSILCVSPPALFAATVYTVKDLGPLIGRIDESRPNAINQSGRVAAANVVGGVYRALIYAGAWTNLATLGGTDSYGAGINDSNLVVGHSLAADGSDHAFLWTPGGIDGALGNPQMRDLGTLGGTASEAFGINRSGQITGFAFTSADDIHAFLYSTGTMTDIGVLLSGLPFSYGYGVNSSGHVAGTAYNSSYNVEHAFFYNGVTAADIGSLGRQGASALAINNNDQVVGYATTSSQVVHAFRYAGGQMNDLGTLGGNESYAVGINNSNVVVGGSNFDPTSTGTHAFILPASSMIDLNTQLDGSGAGWTLVEARAINDAGLIVGTGVYAGANHAFLLNPLPQITQQPADLTITCYSNAWFSVGAIPSPLSYQWYRKGPLNDLSIASATNSTLTLVNASPAQAAGYYAVVTSFYASVTSSVAKLTVLDTLPPVINNCPSNLTNFTAPGLCAAVVTWPNPTAVDSCEGAVPVICTPASGSTFNTGVTTVTCRASDSSGNTNACSFIVTVLDKEAPVLTGCPGDITNYTMVGTPKSVTWTSPAAIDNCQGSVPVTCVPTNGSMFSSGVTVVRCSANDANGNTNYCAFSVNMIAAQAPLITAVSLRGANVVLRFTTQAQAQYGLESKLNIGSGNWTNVFGGIIGTGNELTITNIGGANPPSKFYRVKLLLQ
jgi:probable HAF family extracellular repeat protein